MEKITKEDIVFGVSQWAEYGKKYGYWDYFREQTLKQIEEWAEKNEVKKGEGVMGKDSDLINEEYAHNDVLEDLKKFINTL